MKAGCVGDLLNLIGLIAPWDLAATWDNCGLMVGDRSAPAVKIALALDPSVETVEAAAKKGAQVLLTHHPLIFKPLKCVDLTDPPAAAAAAALRLGLAVVSAHTNLDAAPEGVAASLARRLGLVRTEVLDPIPTSELARVCVFTTEDGGPRAAEVVRAACSTSAPLVYMGPGQGSLEAAAPGSGEERLVRLEALISRADAPGVVGALGAVNSGQQVIFDVHPLPPAPGGAGFGRIGCFEKELKINELVEILNVKLETKSVRASGCLDRVVQKAALMPGSGGSYLGLAKARGADVLISGDLGHHQARDAEFLGLGLIDAGHGPTERPVLNDLAQGLREKSRSQGFDMEFTVLPESGPWYTMEELF